MTEPNSIKLPSAAPMIPGVDTDFLDIMHDPAVNKKKSLYTFDGEYKQIVMLYLKNIFAQMAQYHVDKELVSRLLVITTAINKLPDFMVMGVYPGLPERGPFDTSDPCGNHALPRFIISYRRNVMSWLHDSRIYDWNVPRLRFCMLLTRSVRSYNLEPAGQINHIPITHLGFRLLTQPYTEEDHWYSIMQDVVAAMTDAQNSSLGTRAECASEDKGPIR